MGFTFLFGGRKVSKASAIANAIGSIDELNASLGVLRAYKPLRKTDQLLKRIQCDLFGIGAELADSQKKIKIHAVDENDVGFLEKNIDALEKKLPPLKNFILPDGVLFSAHAHLCRTICRRAERHICALGQKSKINAKIVVYINRLSDLLFMIAREHMFNKKQRETLWNPSLYINL